MPRNAMLNSKRGFFLSPAFLVPTAIVALITTISVRQATGYAANLASYVLYHGRLVLSSGDLVFPASDPRRNGAAALILDGDPERAAVFTYPANHPHGTFILIDTGLTHSPGEPPAVRRPVALKIYNGVCEDCSLDTYRKYGRIKRARVEFMHRRANNPDEEFIIPPVQPVREFIVEFPDRPGPLEISLADVPTPPRSTGWPDGSPWAKSSTSIRTAQAARCLNISISRIDRGAVLHAA